MKTTVHAYRFDLTKPAGREAYAALCAKLEGMGLRKFASLPGENSRLEHLPDGLSLELETAHLFDNQWNTAPVDGLSDKGIRVFDWREPVYFNNGVEIKSSKGGYWLEQSDEMRAARHNRYACGYCDTQADNPAGTFHEGCLDSAYLKESDLALLRWQRCEVSSLARRPDLSDSERVYLVPRYTDAQLRGNTERGKARAAKLRRDLTTKRDGMLWVLDTFGPAMVDNCIFYSHTGRFCFGWRTPLSEAVTSDVVDKISEFPFAYTIKSESRGDLESGPAEE
jgi:hypothetical protein